MNEFFSMKRGVASYERSLQVASTFNTGHSNTKDIKDVT